MTKELFEPNRNCLSVCPLAPGGARALADAAGSTRGSLWLGPSEVVRLVVACTASLTMGLGLELWGRCFACGPSVLCLCRVRVVGSLAVRMRN